MGTNRTNLFQIWKVYQRRAESIGHYFDVDIRYYHYPWEEKTKLHKAASYLFKSIRTLYDLVACRPALVFIQLPPTPALYIVGVYCWLTKTPYIADCHNAMFMSWWLKWPMAKTFLRNAKFVLIHNKEVQKYAEMAQVKVRVMRDPLPQPARTSGAGVLERFGLEPQRYVIAPWNLASDEPIGEFIEAVRAMPDIKFAMTWFTERLPADLRDDLPGNLIFTGYLESDEFDQLFADAGAAISLTVRSGTQPSAASEAIAFGVPVVLSDMLTARQLYDDVPVYVENTSSAIVEGVNKVFSDRDRYCKRVIDFQLKLRTDLEKEITDIKRQLS